MTDTIQAHLAQMRDAADRMRKSARRIETSVQGAADVIDGMMALGAGTPEFQQRYAVYRAQMTEWAATLDGFADKLSSAADDIEGATGDTRVYTGLLLPIRRRRAYMPERDRIPPPAAIPAATAPPTPQMYVSRRNRPLYEAWRAAQDELTGREGTLASLTDTRAARADDLAALRNRLHSYDPTLNVDGIPRVAALQAEVDALDVQIAGLETEIEAARGRVAALETRLGRVMPGAGADPALIAALEGGESAGWLRANTFDCVRHVVERVNIPHQLAADAHLWGQMAAQHPEFGVTLGETPLEGALLMMSPEHSYADDVNGHLLYVERVSGGEVWVTDNYHPTEPVRLSDITDETTGAHVRYLYLPWHTQG